MKIVSLDLKSNKFKDDLPVINIINVINRRASSVLNDLYNKKKSEMGFAIESPTKIEII